MMKRILFAVLLVLPVIGAARPVALDPVPECFPCGPKPPTPPPPGGGGVAPAGQFLIG